MDFPRSALQNIQRDCLAIYILELLITNRTMNKENKKI